MSAAAKFEAGQIYVHAADLPAPVPFELAPEVRQWRDEIKAIDDAQHATPALPVEPFGQRLRHAQDVARARDQGYAQGYMDGLAARVHVTPAARMVSALLGAAACGLGFWGYHLVRAWL